MVANPKFQAQVDGWGTAHGKWLPTTWDSTKSRNRNEFGTFFLNYL